MCLLYIYMYAWENGNSLFSKMMEVTNNDTLNNSFFEIFLAYGNFSRIFRELRKVVNKWKSKKEDRERIIGLDTRDRWRNWET